jgi:hypothetical protein
MVLAASRFRYMQELHWRLQIQKVVLPMSPVADMKTLGDALRFIKQTAKNRF